MDMFTTRFMEMPTKIRAFTVRDADFDYTICINSRISYEQQLEAYKHELKHINHGDFDNDDVQQVEAEAHRKEE